MWLDLGESGLERRLRFRSKMHGKNHGNLCASECVELCEVIASIHKFHRPLFQGFEVDCPVVVSQRWRNFRPKQVRYLEKRYHELFIENVSLEVLVRYVRNSACV